jgi:hypothetical protein
MKPNFSLKDSMFTRGLAAMLLGAALLASGAATSADGKSAAGLAYVSGGVGEESRARLDAMAGDFNLKLVFAMKSGAYLGKIRVTIADGSGRPLVDSTSEGPWFLARLPVGNYRVVASYEGDAIARDIAVGAGKPRTIDFRWSPK